MKIKFNKTKISKKELYKSIYKLKGRNRQLCDSNESLEETNKTLYDTNESLIETSKELQRLLTEAQHHNIEYAERETVLIGRENNVKFIELKYEMLLERVNDLKGIVKEVFTNCVLNVNKG